MQKLTYGSSRVVKRWLLALLPLLAGIIFMFARPAAHAANPNIISFQGKVVNADGTNVVNGSYNFDFVLYDDPTLGTPSDGIHDKWHELNKSVTVTNGVFQTNLGSVTALPDFNANSSLYLAVRFNGDAAGYMTPRVQMASVPYAKNADTVGGVSASNIVQLGASQSGNINIGSGTLTSGTINGQTISASANFTGSLAVAGGTATLGSSSNVAGSLVLFDGSGNTAVTLTAGGVGTGYSLTLPTAAGGTSECLQTHSSTASQLVFGACGGGGGGDNISVNGSAITDANFLNTTATASVAGTTFSVNTGANPDAVTLTVSDASGSVAGIVTANAQTFGGVKTFNDNIILATGKTLTVTGDGTVNRPAGTEGQIYYDTDTDKLLLFSNGKWQADRADAIIVAASNSAQAYRDAADFIADGDGGSAGDGDQVQINAALTAAGDGGTVYIAKGSYTADASITVGTRQVLSGAGDETLITLGTINATDNLIETSSGSVVKDLSLAGGSSTSGLQHGINVATGVKINSISLAGFTRGYAINIAGANNITIRDIRVGGTGTTGINIGGTTSNITIDGYYAESEIGVYASGTSNDLLIQNSTFYQNAQFGLWIDNSTGNNVQLISNYFHDMPDVAIQIDDSSENKLHKNRIVINGGSNAINLNASSKNFITENYVEGAGIALEIAGASDRNNVSNNYITGNAVGMRLTTGGNNVITGNSFYLNTTTGLELGSTSFNSTVSNNKFVNNGGSTTNQGLVISSSNNNTVTANTFTDNSCSTTCNAIAISGAGATNNYLSDNTLAGSGTPVISDAGTGTIYSMQATSATGSIVLKTAASNTAFSVQTTAGSRVLTVDNSSNETELGNDSLAGKLVFFDSDTGSETVTLQGGATTSSYSLTLPTSGPSTSQCLQTDSVTASQLVFGACGGGGGGDNITVNGSAATDANFLNTTATASVAGTTFALNTGATPDAITLTISDASATVAGIVTANAQTFGGLKTFEDGIEFTESDTNPTCASGNFNIYADLSENKLKQCVNGTVSDIGASTKYETFTATGTYTKPADAAMVIVDAWGGGGGGGGGAGGSNAAARTGGGGGGGGSFSTGSFLASNLGSTVPVTIGNGGNGGNGGSNTVGTNGFAGNSTCFSTTTACAGTMLLQAYAGGGGGGAGATGNGGGGGGGSGAVGNNSTAAAGGAGGGPLGSSAGAANSGSGGGGGATAAATAANGGVSQYGGAGGGASTTAGANTSGAGGSSVRGGAGGGGGGSCAITTCTARAGGAGGSSPSAVPGGGGTAGTAQAGGAGANGTSFGGAGGGGGSNSNTVSGRAGGNGGTPGGGGGGGGGSHTGSTIGGTGGTGGRGELRIWTIRGSGADLAEIYGTYDELSPGDVVCLDTTMRAGVKKCTSAYDKLTLGVISTSPGLVIGDIEDAGAKPAMVVLTGRTPIKVSDENGIIEAGDLLTPSSVPGVAMKATKAGIILGQAMGPYHGIGEGMTMVFTRTNYGLGVSASSLVNTKSNEEPESKQILSYLTNVNTALGKPTDMSEVFTDRLTAGIEVITPKLITETILTDKIEASKNEDITLKLSENGSFILTDAEGEKKISFNSHGDAHFFGTITAHTIRADRIEGIEILSNRITELNTQLASYTDKEIKPANLSNKDISENGTVSIGELGIVNFNSAVVDFDLSVGGDLTVRGGLRIGADAYFEGISVFTRLVGFMDEVVFNKDVSFIGTPTFNNDMGGFATIYKSQRSVKVTFSKPFKDVPVVVATIKNGSFEKYSYKDLTKEGFTIILPQEASEDVEFSWTALNIKDARNISVKVDEANQED